MNGGCCAARVCARKQMSLTHTLWALWHYEALLCLLDGWKLMCTRQKMTDEDERIKDEETKRRKKKSVPASPALQRIHQQRAVSAAETGL